MLLGCLVAFTVSSTGHRNDIKFGIQEHFLLVQWKIVSRNHNNLRHWSRWVSEICLNLSWLNVLNIYCIKDSSTRYPCKIINVLVTPYPDKAYIPSIILSMALKVRTSIINNFKMFQGNPSQWPETSLTEVIYGNSALTVRRYQTLWECPATRHIKTQREANLGHIPTPYALSFPLYLVGKSLHSHLLSTVQLLHHPHRELISLAGDLVCEVLSLHWMSWPSGKGSSNKCENRLFLLFGCSRVILQSGLYNKDKSIYDIAIIALRVIHNSQLVTTRYLHVVRCPPFPGHWKTQQVPCLLFSFLFQSSADSSDCCISFHCTWQSVLRSSFFQPKWVYIRLWFKSLSLN